MISISIVIPVFNEEKTILDILKKIDLIKSHAELEIIIINDGSTDNTKEILDQNSKYYNHIEHL